MFANPNPGTYISYAFYSCSIAVRKTPEKHKYTDKQYRQTIKDWVYASKFLKDGVVDGCLPHSLCASNRSRAMEISDEIEVAAIAVDESKIA